MQNKSEMNQNTRAGRLMDSKSTAILKLYRIHEETSPIIRNVNIADKWNHFQMNKMEKEQEIFKLSV